MLVSFSTPTPSSMNKILTIVCLLAGPMLLQAQNFFRYEPKEPASLQNRSDREVIPSKYAHFTLGLSQIQNYLSDAPMEALGTGSRQQHKELNVPMPDGQLETFFVYEAPVMEQGLAIKYPGIKSYKGYNADQSKVIRFDIGSYGFHGAIRTRQGDIYIDPYVKGFSENYISYFTKHHNPEANSSCGVSDEVHPLRRDNYKPQEVARSGNVNLHVYRLAIACTGEWGAVRGTKERALSDMITSVNRLNLIFENEMASRMILVADNDKVLFLDPDTDEYTEANQGRSLLTQNTRVLNTFLGVNTYDLGHIYTRGCTDVGGVAFLGSMCTNVTKGAGVTCHSSNNIINISVQIAAHEMGHQFGANHTFNNCGGNEATGNAFEPGSGSTIMSYGGLCGSNNVQGFNDDYYHHASLVEIYNGLRVEGAGAFTCAQQMPTSNTAPQAEILVPEGLVIPIRTPFYLRGRGIDPDDNNVLTYAWDQKDLGPSTSLGEPILNGPSFRALAATPNPVRLFPNKSSIFTRIPNIREVLPTYTRVFNFAFVVRDNHPEGGVAAWDQIRFNANENAGPFTVTSQNSGGNFTKGQEIDVTWDVNNTNIAPVNATHVDIYLSVNDALFDDMDNMIPLAIRVPNNGAAKVVLPNVNTARGRIVIAGHNHIFFDVSDFPMIISEPTEPKSYFDLAFSTEQRCLPVEIDLTLTTAGLGGYDGKMNFEVIGLPVGANIDIPTSSVDVNQVLGLKMDFSNDVPTGLYELTIVGSGEVGDTIRRTVFVDVISTNYSDFALAGPEDGLTGSSVLVNFTWEPSQNATEYEIQVATSPAFTPESIISSGITANSNFTPVATFDKSLILYWRVRPINSCGVGAWSELRALSTESAACEEFSAVNLPVTISASLPVTREGIINITKSGIISDVNVKRLRIAHQNFRDLTGTIISPAGNRVVLFQNQCLGNRTFNGGFDDEAPRPFSCTFTAGFQYRPQIDKLEVFNGQNILGAWRVELTDNAVENGGSFNEMVLEICSSITLNSPFLVNNDTLRMFPRNTRVIGADLLQTRDDDNTADQLIYTIVRMPRFGQLTIDGNPVSVGTTFTQTAINNGQLSYRNTEDTEEDAFAFTVIDGTGGWVSTTNFTILVDEDFVNAVNDPVLEALVKVFPNPATTTVEVVLANQANQFHTVQLIDVTGKVKIQQPIQYRKTLNVQDLSSGFYILRLSGDNQSVTKKLVIQK